MGHDTDNGTSNFASQFMRQTVAKVKAGGAAGPLIAPVMLAASGTNGASITTGGTPNTWQKDSGPHAVVIHNPSVDNGNFKRPHSPNTASYTPDWKSPDTFFYQELDTAFDTSAGFKLEYPTWVHGGTAANQGFGLYTEGETNFATPTKPYIRFRVQLSATPDDFNCWVNDDYNLIDTVYNIPGYGYQPCWITFDPVGNTYRHEIRNDNYSANYGTSDDLDWVTSFPSNIKYVGFWVGANGNAHTQTCIYLNTLAGDYHDFDISNAT